MYGTRGACRIALALCGAVALALSWGGCKQEPIIVIHFDSGPSDAGVSSTATATASRKRIEARPDASPGTAVDASPGRECARDGDCVATKAECCGCSAGGKAIAIARASAAGYEAKLEARCRDVLCPQVMSSDPSCRKVPACRDARCVLVEPHAK